MKYVLILLVVLGLAVTLGSPVLAQTSGTSSTGSKVEIPNPIFCKSATCLITQVIRYILGVIAILATFMFVWGGVVLLTSAGNADRVKQGRETLTWAAIGIVIIILSWAMIRFVITGLLR